MRVNRESSMGVFLVVVIPLFLFIVAILLMLTYLRGDELALGIIILVIVFVNWLKISYDYMEEWI